MKLIVHTDGGAVLGKIAVIGYTIDDADGNRLAIHYQNIGIRTSNEAEYIACIEALRRSLLWDPAEIVFKSDSRLLVEQLSGNWRIKHPNMKALAKIFRADIGCLNNGILVRFVHIPRELNAEADALANLGYREPCIPITYS